MLEEGLYRRQNLSSLVNRCSQAPQEVDTAVDRKKNEANNPDRVQRLAGGCLTRGCAAILLVLLQRRRLHNVDSTRDPRIVLLRMTVFGGVKITTTL